MICPKCRGCGEVATSQHEEPWIDWMMLPLKDLIAWQQGLIGPKSCDMCNGKGRLEHGIDQES
jgi:hypothetical protein